MRLEDKIWAVSANSESGDHYGPYLYHKKPTEEQLTSLAKQLDYGQGDGPGYAGSYVYFKVRQVEFQD